LHPMSPTEFRYGGAPTSVQRVVKAPPTVAQAARLRKLRLAHKVQVGPVVTSGVECSELDWEGRQCVWSWALGHISGHQCILRLELDPTVVQHLGNYPRDQPKPDKDGVDVWLPLMAHGCFGLGCIDIRLQALRHEMQRKGPKNTLEEALKAIEEVCGAPRATLQAEDWERGLKRLARKAWCESSDPCAYIRVQVWRELVRVYTGAEDIDDELELAEMADSAILDWIVGDTEDMRTTAKSMPSSQLKSQASRMNGYVPTTVDFAQRLKQAMKNLQQLQGTKAYRILGVKPGSSRALIKKVFRKKALKLHPDKGGDQAAFVALQEAYNEIMELLDKREAAEENNETNENYETNDDENMEGEVDEEDDVDSDDIELDSVFEKESEKNCDSKGNFDFSCASSEVKPESEPEPSSTGDDSDEEGGVGWFARKELEAADRAADLANSVVMHGHAVLEMLDEQPIDWSRCCQHVELALAAARSVVRFANSTADLTGKVATAMSDHLDVWLQSKRGLDEAEQGTMEQSMRTKITEATEASLVLISSASTTVRCIKDASAVYWGAKESLVGGRFSEDVSQRLTFHSAIGSLVEAAYGAAEAAQGAADAVQEIQREERPDLLEHRSSSDMQAEPEGEADPEGYTGNVQRKQESQQERLLAEASLLEAMGQLKLFNHEILSLQHSVQELLKRKAIDEEALADYKEIAFLLLAEFVESSAHKFFTKMQSALQSNKSLAPKALLGLIIQTARNAFSFVVDSNPALAVPVDPRSQALRAAVALDVKAARDMLEIETIERLRGHLVKVLQSVSCDAGAWQAAASAIEATKDILLESFGRLEEGAKALEQQNESRRASYPQSYSQKDERRRTV